MILNKIISKYNKVSPILILSPCVEAIGSTAQEIYHGLLKARREKKKILFIFPYEFLFIKFSKFGLGINEELKKIESKYRICNYYNPISIFLNLVLTIVFIILILYKKIFRLKNRNDLRIPKLGSEELWNWDMKKKFTFEKKMAEQWKQDYESFVDVRIGKRKLKKAEKIRVSMGLPLNAWYVCVFVRDSGYYGKKIVEKIVKTSRNADISNYIPAIEEITKRGGYVVRMGDNSMKKLTPLRNVIDYPFTKYKSDLMDIYLTSKCKCFLGNPSGIWDVADLFQKPMIAPDVVAPLYFLPPKKGDLLIFKHVFHKKNNSLVPLMDRLKRPNNYYLFNENYYFENNSADEIKNLVIEFFDDKKDKNDELQHEFKNEIIRNGLKNIELETAGSLRMQYRNFAFLLGRSGSIGSSYLKDNFHNEKR